MAPRIPSTPATPAFGDPAAIRCERAAAELRAGRPVLLEAGDGRLLAFLAVDGSVAGTFDAFLRAADGGHYLFLTPERAAAIGIDAPAGARLPLDGVDHAALAPLAFGRDVVLPASWRAGDALDACAARVARLALLLPALVACDVPADAVAFAGCARLAAADLDGGAALAEREYEIVARTPVPLDGLGTAQFVVFRGGVAQRDQVAVVIGTPDPHAAVPVRVHSSCLTGDLFGSLMCDCGDQLHRALHALHALGGGVLLYLDQEGRGTGIAAKMRAYGYQHAGLDTIDADAQLGFGADGRRYGAAVAMLQGLGVARIRLLSNNPGKAARLREAGIEVVESIALTGAVTAQNERYLRTKALRGGHLLDVDALLRELR